MGGGRGGSGKTCVQSGDTDRSGPPARRRGGGGATWFMKREKDEAKTQVFFNKIFTTNIQLHVGLILESLSLLCIIRLITVLLPVGRPCLGCQHPVQ